MNIKTLIAVSLLSLCAAGPAAAASGNVAASSSGPGGTNVDNISFSVAGNQVVITTGTGAGGGTVAILPGQTAGQAIEALVAEMLATGGGFGGLRAQAIRAAAAAQGIN